MRPATRADLVDLPVEVAPRLLGALLETEVAGERVVARLTEVEAYHGLGTGERPIRVRTPAWADGAQRHDVGGAGHLYVYLSHGIHSCVNVVCGPEGVAGGVLLRGGEIVEGADIAERRRLERRGAVRASRDLARGPGRFGDAVGLRHPIHDGIDAVTGAERAGARARLLLPRARRRSWRRGRAWGSRASPAPTRSRGASGSRGMPRSRRSAGAGARRRRVGREGADPAKPRCLDGLGDLAFDDLIRSRRHAVLD